MQTFLPFADFRASAEVLDDKRLGKQRVETLQVMRALTLPDYGWQHHPVTAMWRGYRPALMAYQDATCSVWLERGYADTCLAKTLEDLARVPEDLAAYERGDYPRPAWNDDEAVHVSHRSKLVQKDREHYLPLFPDVPDDLDYVWPVQSASALKRSASTAPRRAG
ncbi:MSMEG_6728 family protein [Curtobacterium sp. SL109]|uniref:MSMEG_6728 family protein n=1 Tax=Curtobacterium sp. SL109 TaxID=2994662 RepID=UPI002276E42B|nr:MSMEG_6728 family protein [Curtobacterium sp. SL109]MCY1696068.1 MSMEG_6728 family protein [Curtobacterium sp. SL109]